MTMNRRIVVAERPRYFIPTTNCFRMEEQPVREPEDGEVLIRTLWLSLDPYLHGRLKRASSQAEPVAIGDVMVGATVGRIEASKRPDYEKGDLVLGFWGWQEYAVQDDRYLRRLDKGMEHPSYALGALGLPGFGAYLALNDLSPAAEEETVVIGTATGALGQIAGQIAKLKGCRAIGVAGGRDKCELATEHLGYETCVDHTAKDFTDQLQAACPNGIDVYVETMGGEVFDAVLPLLNLHARMTVCGLMSLYTMTQLPKGPDRTMVFLNQINLKRLQVRGLVTFDHLKTWFQPFWDEMSDWIEQGRVEPVEDVMDGLEKAPRALQDMFEGKNRGKVLVRVGE